MNTVSNALTATVLLRQQRKLHETMDKMQEAGVKAFQAGQKAKQQGFSRVSPYYKKPLLDECFFAGYDQQISDVQVPEIAQCRQREKKCRRKGLAPSPNSSPAA